MNQEESTPAAVQLVNIRKGFGERTILAGIDLTIARGEVLVLVGPSGSGKSTLLKIVSGIETPDGGEVWLDGELCTETPPYRRPVHTVFQNYALFPHLDVAGNVAFPLAVAGMPRAGRGPLVEQALTWVRMQQHARRRIDTLSGGERQRVALARALVDRPRCVLLDEPLSALDPHLRAGTLDLLQQLQAELGLTYLFITHDREEALRIGHRIGVLNHGRLEQLGTPEEVYHRPQTAFVASFLGKINWLNGQLMAAGESCAVVIEGQRIRLESRPSLAPGPVKIGIRPEDLRVVAIESSPTLRAGQSGYLAPGSSALQKHQAPNAPRAHTECGPTIPVRVVSRLFFGDSTTVRVATDDGTELVVDQRPASDAAPGQRVALAWSPAAMHLFPANEDFTDENIAGSNIADGEAAQ